MAYDLAAKGHRVVLVTVPLRLAFMTWQAEKVWSRTWAALEANPSRRWVVGGHSRGGRMAAEFVHEYPEEVAGLLLVGTSHPKRLDLSHERLAVLKVYGSEDGLASEEEIDQFASNLPDHTEWVRVEGGNHAHFAWYGFQFGDGSAHIARADQHRQLVQATDAFLNKLDRADAFLMRPTDEGESR
jgi:pimeloyl-ACP methyl ester carboxylesterase